MTTPPLHADASPAPATGAAAPGATEVTEAIQAPKRIDIKSFQRAQLAMKAASRGERLQAALDSHDGAAPAKPARSAAKKPAAPFNAVTRESALHRAVSLLRTMAEYYGITVGELDDEEKRLRELPDERLRQTITAYEFTSRHVGVMLGDEKARDVAISQNPEIAAFYEQHGASEDDLNQANQCANEASKAKVRRSQPA